MRALAARLAPRRTLLALDPADPLYAATGERLAARTLARQGLVVLARRLSTRWAELDVLCREGGTLVVVEVKTGRAGPRFRPAMRVRREALERLGRAARDLARGAPWRIDVCEVRLEGKTVSVVHLRDFRTPL